MRPKVNTLCGLLIEANQSFGVAIDLLVELLVSLGSFIDAYMMAHDFAGLRLAVHNRVAKIFIVFLDWSWPAAQRRIGSNP